MTPYGAIALLLIALVQPASARFSPGQQALADATLAAAKSGLARTLADYPSARFRNAKAYYEAEVENVRICGEVNARDAQGREIGWKQFLALPDGTVLVFDETAAPPADTANYIIKVVCEGRTAVVDTADYAESLTFKP